LGFLWQLVLAMLPVALGAVLAFYFGTQHSTSAPATCTSITTRIANQLTAENDFRHGVWTFSSPTIFSGFSNQDARPSTGVRWLPNCTGVAVRCVRNGGAYRFENTIHAQLVQLTWKSWAQLDRGDWLPLASVGETTGLRQARLGLKSCTNA